MLKHLTLAGSATLLIAVGGWAFAQRGQSAPARDDRDPKSQLIEADRAFAKTTAEKGLEGWMSVFADDAVRISPLGGKASFGKGAIQKLDANLFSDPKRILIWEPVDAGVFADGSHGFTTGRAKAVDRAAGDKDQGPWTVKYVTFWRKGADGRWKVILDTGASESPKP
jgi:ketosteroid isomerase-like protein